MNVEFLLLRLNGRNGHVYRNMITGRDRSSQEIQSTHIYHMLHNPGKNSGGKFQSMYFAFVYPALSFWTLTHILERRCENYPVIYSIYPDWSQGGPASCIFVKRGRELFGIPLFPCIRGQEINCTSDITLCKWVIFFHANAVIQIGMVLGFSVSLVQCAEQQADTIAHPFQNHWNIQNVASCTAITDSS